MRYLGVKGMEKVKILELRKCQGSERFLVVNGALVRLSEFPNLSQVASTGPKRDITAGSVEESPMFDHEEARYTHPKEWYKDVEEHTAESVWQNCNCRTCQDVREFKELPRYTSFRNKDEHY